MLRISGSARRDGKKKLEAAARYWATPAPPKKEEPTAADDLEAFGAPPEVVEAARDPIEAEAENFDVLPENWDAVRLFSALGTQWQVSMGAFVGIRYEALESTARLQGIDGAALFNKVRVMESIAIGVLNNKAEK